MPRSLSLSFALARAIATISNIWNKMIPLTSNALIYLTSFDIYDTLFARTHAHTLTRSLTCSVRKIDKRKKYKESVISVTAQPSFALSLSPLLSPPLHVKCNCNSTKNNNLIKKRRYSKSRHTFGHMHTYKHSLIHLQSRRIFHCPFSEQIKEKIAKYIKCSRIKKER